MSHYWKRCPHCGRTVEQGYGFPTKQLGDPKRRCRFCANSYNDSSIIDWENASVFRKVQYYFANGRFFICFIPYVIATARVGTNNINWSDWKVYLACSPVFLIAFLPCALYVRHQVKDYLDLYGYENEDSKKQISFEDQYKDGLFSNTSRNKPKPKTKRRR
jgi:hypothetical protein